MKRFLRSIALLFFLLSLCLWPASTPAAQASVPRLVVFEGFYNPN